MRLPAPDLALLRLLELLRERGYRFVAVTPVTHERVVTRAAPQRTDLRGVFGWNLPFRREDVPAEILACLEEAGGVEEAPGGLVRSRFRVASLGERLFLHSSYPTMAEDSVFFGPDTYRFAKFIEAEMADRRQVSTIFDIGAGSGAGGLAAGALSPEARLVLSDVNEAALRLAAINAEHQGRQVELVHASGVPDGAGAPDLIVANPPYIADGESGRRYRDGGAMAGAALSLEWALEGAGRLAPGGRMLLYTGVAIAGGEDRLRDELERELPALGCTLRYCELDPDVFGEELDREAYADAERIAAVGAVIEKGA